MAVRATIRDQCLFCVRHSQMLRINGHNIGASTDGTLNGWSAKVLLHISSPVRATQENR